MKPAAWDNIVQVSPFYPPYLGGMENVAKTIAETLAERYPVEVLTTTCGSQGAPRRERHGRLVVHRHRAIEIAHAPIAPGLFFRLLRLPRRAVVHVHMANAFVAELVWLASLLRRRRPFILHFHLDVEPSGRLGWLLPTYKRLVFGRVLRAASGVIALSCEQAQFLDHQYGVPRDRIVVVPNGVAPEFFAAPDRMANAHRAALRLLYVGRLCPQKNLPRLLQALQLVASPVELTIVGDGEDKELVARLIDQLGMSNVHVAGTQRGEQLLGWYRWADAFVLPSDKEGMPLVLLEAMAAGLPILATDVPGSREIVGGVGLLAQTEPTALAEAITRLAEDPDLRRDLAERGVARARSLSWDVLVDDMEDLYERIAL